MQVICGGRKSVSVPLHHRSCASMAALSHEERLLTPNVDPDDSDELLEGTETSGGDMSGEPVREELSASVLWAECEYTQGSTLIQYSGPAKYYTMRDDDGNREWVNTVLARPGIGAKGHIFIVVHQANARRTGRLKIEEIDSMTFTLCSEECTPQSDHVCLF